MSLRCPTGLPSITVPRYMSEEDKRHSLVDIVNSVKGLTLVFVETKRGADALEEYLCREGAWLATSFQSIFVLK